MGWLEGTHPLSVPLNTAAGTKSTESASFEAVESRWPVITKIVAPVFLAFCVTVLMWLISPQPLTTMKRSPLLIPGQVSSQMKWVSLPRCMSLIANDLAASPSRPTPITKILLALATAWVKAMRPLRSSFSKTLRCSSSTVLLKF